MDRLTTVALRIGDWRLDAQQGTLTRGSHTERLEARTLRLLVYLANRAGETVSMEELLDNVWSGVVVTQDSVYQAITALRRLLGDDARSPQYIATVPRLGYRLLAPVNPWVEAPLPVPAATPPPARIRLPRRVGASLAGVVLLALAGVMAWRADRAPAQKSVAVLPFLDLTTQAMKEEYFADGLTEELIQRLSKLPGFVVPAPTASFYFKDKLLPVTEIANQLNVRYLLDGSLRESGETLRISARLLRAEDGFVLWTESYDRPKSDRVMIQDDIASEVAQALSQSVR
jgi:TolB-like protein/DNA-binding winged helix-turn-helix (wHTH) protein